MFGTYRAPSRMYPDGSVDWRAGDYSEETSAIRTFIGRQGREDYGQAQDCLTCGLQKIITYSPATGFRSGS